jgi:aspartyl-tRNA(Asn)/glutamyl-tRNA(Gln) amidotransferase subunit A
MINNSLKRLGYMLQAKTISSVELTQSFLARISQYNPSINAYISLDESKTLAQAKAADARIAAGNAGYTNRAERHFLCKRLAYDLWL